MSLSYQANVYNPFASNYCTPDIGLWLVSKADINARTLCLLQLGFFENQAELANLPNFPAKFA